MRRLNKEQGVTFIFATHDRRIMEHASRLVWMEDGRITQAAG
jgi:putative ABC transport system ATP-binding protein